MLFSSDAIAKMINDSFEPVWESVREVPMVTIDFGRGNVVKRTLNGNIATYVCDSKGRVLDVLPGMYDPDSYSNALSQLLLLKRFTEGRNLDDARRQMNLKEYHSRQFAALKANRPPERLLNVGDMSKALVENPIKMLAHIPGTPNISVYNPQAPALIKSEGKLSNWKTLVEDTKLNETERRQLIHEKLAASGWIKPADMKTWLYREVLHADIEDPYLGLREALFKNYPFTSEESVK